MTPPGKWRWALGTALMAAFLMGSAQRGGPQEIPLEEVVVTATRTPVPREKVAQSVTVIDRKVIEQSGARDVLELLRRVPGLSVSRAGSRGGTATLFPRGGESDFNLVLIDGVKVNEAGGFFDFSRLTTENVERIEILRGPQSALYGSEAMGSVIQVFTRRGKGPPRVEGSALGGSFGTFEEGVSLTLGEGPFGLSVSGGRVDSEGILPLNNDFRQTVASARLDATAGEVGEFQLSTRYTRGRFHFPTGSAGDRFDPPDPRQLTDQKLLVLSPRAEVTWVPWWRHVLQLGFTHQERLFRDPEDPGVDFLDFRSETKERRLSADYSSHIELPKLSGWAGLLTLGGAIEDEAFDQRTRLVLGGTLSTARTERVRTNRAAYGQVQVNFLERFFLTPGVRFDDNTTFGFETSPRVSGAFIFPGSETKLRATYAKGIKAPAFLELFGLGTLVGNPDLKPERSEGWEVGIDQPLFGRRFLAEATFFHNRFTNLIAFVGGPGPNFQNIQSARSLGVELSSTLSPGFGLSFIGSYTFTKTEVLDDGGVGGTAFPKGQDLLRRPRHKGSLEIGYEGRGIQTRLSLLVVGEAIDRDFSSFPERRVTLPGYQRLDLGFSYELPENWMGRRGIRILLRGENLLDQDYEEAFGFSSPGVSLLAGFKVDLGGTSR